MVEIYTVVSLIMLGAWATIFHRAAKVEDVPPFAWAGLSILVFCITWLYFGWGWIGCNVAQAVLFVAVGVAKGLMREFGQGGKKKKRKKRRSSSIQRPNAS